MNGNPLITSGLNRHMRRHETTAPRPTVDLYADLWGSEPGNRPFPRAPHVPSAPPRPEQLASAPANSIEPNPHVDLNNARNLPSTGGATVSPNFNSLHISHLPLKVDGQTEHLFAAILNGEVVGQVIAMKQEWGACGLRMLYVAPKHRHMGIGSRLISRVQVFAHNEKCSSIEIAVLKSNTEGRKFWIRRRFIDEEDNRGLSEDYTCMARAI